MNVLSHALIVYAGFIPGIELRLHCFNFLLVAAKARCEITHVDARDSMDIQWPPVSHEQAYKQDVTRSESAV